MLVYKLKQEDKLTRQKQTIDTLHAMMAQFLENTKKKKKSSRHCKKKYTLTLSASSDKWEKEYDLRIEISSKHSKPLDSGEGGSQHLNELERRLDAIVNREKLQEAGLD